MPVSKKPRSKDSNRAATNRRTLQIINQAQALDRRRQAQIENQKQSINRLLARFDGVQLLDPQTGHPLMPPSSHAVYGEEMRTLHEAAAELVAREQEAREVMRQLVAAIDGLPLDGLRLGRGAHVTAFAEALAQARALVSVSAPVTESTGQAG